MASVSVEFSASGDPRFRYAAKLIGTSRFDVLGRAVEVWRCCIEGNTAILPTVMVDAITELDGFAEIMMQVGLAERVDDATMRIKGTAGRIEYLAEARERQKNATRVAAETRRKAREERVDPKSVPILVPKLEPPLESSSTSTSASKKKRSLVDPADTTRLWKFYSQELKTKGIEAVHEGAKTNKLCQTLVKAHGVEKAQNLVIAFLNDKDPFVTDKAYALGFLVSQQQKYLARINSAHRKAPLDFGGDT